MKSTNVFSNGKCVGTVPVTTRVFDGYRIEKTKNSVYIIKNDGESFWCSISNCSWKYVEQMADWLVNHIEEPAPKWVNDFVMQINHYRTSETSRVWIKGWLA